MPSSSYSARFLHGVGDNREEIYTVPAGRRAVVRFTRYYVWTVPCTVTLYVHGIAVEYFRAPEAQSTYAADCRYIAYEGETIRVVVTGVAGAYAVSGFLFYDADGEPDDAGNIIKPIGLTKPVDPEEYSR